MAQLSQRWGSLVSASCVPASPSSRYQPSCTAWLHCTGEDTPPGHLQPRVAVQARSAGAGLAYPPPPLRQRGVVLAGTCGGAPHTAVMITLSLTVIPRAVAQRGQLGAGGLLGGGHDGVDDAGP